MGFQRKSKISSLHFSFGFLQLFTMEYKKQWVFEFKVKTMGVNL